MQLPATQDGKQGGGSKCNETSGKEENLILKNEAPGDAAFSGKTLVQSWERSLKLFSPACWGAAEGTKAKSKSGVHWGGKRREGHKAGARGRVLGFHPGFPIPVFVPVGSSQQPRVAGGDSTEKAASRGRWPRHPCHSAVIDKNNSFPSAAIKRLPE